ncbi:MAG: MMPL family transporter [Sphaerochaeta sp.]|jgi:predicted RND superfamily exporter protein|uniref:efflux RND transporter permease subunit n=1 Tax=Sphaerochaeta sp. TaxID=1972642 RepID=UPI002A362C5D|nr:MMPL family transporter [Sphaerochaeta sp.]MDX9824373.1 MMPL family transporter [Sphaerochaeta sp.]
MERQRSRDLLIVTVFIVAAAVSLLGIGRLKVDSSTDAFIPAKAPVVETNNRIEEQFGSLDALVISLYDEGGIINKENLAVIDSLTRKIETLDGVKQASSITNLKHLKPSEDGVDVVPLFEESINELEEHIASWPGFYEGTFLSEDRSSASILIQTQLDYNQAELLGSLRAILAPLDGLQGSILGLPVVTEQIRISLLADLAFLVPIVAALIMLVLYLFLRSFKATLLCLVPLIFSSSLALGIMSIAGITFTMATMLVPVLLLIVGSAYTIHIFSHFFEEYEKVGVDAALANVVKKNTYPILAAAATTAFGFLAQLSSPLLPFRTFGLLSFIGVAICAASSLLLLPALIRLVYKNPVRRQVRKQATRRGLWAGVGNTIANRYGKAVPIASLLILGIVLPLSYSQLEEGTNILAFFKDSSTLVQDTRSYNQRMQGSFSLSVMLKPSEAVLLPGTLHIVEEAITVLEKENQVGGIQSILPFVKRMNQLLGPGEDARESNAMEPEPVFDFFSDTSYEMATEQLYEPSVELAGGMGKYEIPLNPAEYGLETEEQLASLIAQYLLLYSSSLDAFINDPLEPDALLITILLKDSDTKTLRHLTALIPTLFPQSWSVEIGGGEAVSLALTDLVTKSQVISLFSSLLAVWLLVLFTFKSAKLATLSLIPCLFALASVFSVMAIFHIKLDIITSLLAALCIGVGVDYAIHLIAAFQRNDQDVASVMQTTGKAILANAASVALGFSGLLFSRFVPIVNMGLLFSIAMLSAALSALLILGAIKIHYSPCITRRPS